MHARLRRVLVVLGWFASVGPGLAEAVCRLPPEDIVRAMAAAPMAEPSQAGLFVGAVAREGSVAVGIGVADRRTGRKVDADTVFLTASTGKSFAGALLARYVQEGRVALEDRAVDLLPSLGLQSHPEGAYRLIDLATHTAGLSYRKFGYLAARMLGQELGRTPTVDEFLAALESDLPLEALRRLPVDDPPGARFGYSNVGIQVLALALAAAGEGGFEEVLARDLFAPAGMADTRLDPTPELAERKATGHDKDGRPAPDGIMPGLPAAGAYVTTGADMMQWLRVNLGLDRPELHALIAPAQAIHRQGKDLPGFAPEWSDVTDLGLAWFIRRDADGGVARVDHLGGTSGFTAYVGFAPAAGCGIVLLSNSGDPEPVFRLRDELFEWMLGAGG